jgi:hypothetical protein
MSKTFTNKQVFGKKALNEYGVMGMKWGVKKGTRDVIAKNARAYRNSERIIAPPGRSRRSLNRTTRSVIATDLERGRRASTLKALRGTGMKNSQVRDTLHIGNYGGSSSMPRGFHR